MYAIVCEQQLLKKNVFIFRLRSTWSNVQIAGASIVRKTVPDTWGTVCAKLRCAETVLILGTSSRLGLEDINCRDGLYVRLE